MCVWLLARLGIIVIAMVSYTFIDWLTANNIADY